MSKVSVVIPVYNVEAYVEKCIKSIISQSYDDTEIIIVNDGSTDLSGAICQKYEKLDARIKVIWQNNAGLSSARNTGLKYATGEYITFVDSDDWLEKNMIKRLMGVVEDTSADIVVGKHKISTMEDSPKKKLPKALLNGEAKEYRQTEALLQLFSGSIPAYAWGKIYKTSLFKDNDILYPTGIHYEDIGTIYKLVSKAYSVISVCDYIYNYRVRPGSITASYHIKDVEDILYIQMQIYNYFKDSTVSKNMYYSYYQLSLLFLALSILYKCNEDIKSNKYILRVIKDRKKKWKLDFFWILKNTNLPMMFKVVLMKYNLAYIVVKSSEILKKGIARRRRKKDEIANRAHGLSL